MPAGLGVAAKQGAKKKKKKKRDEKKDDEEDSGDEEGGSDSTDTTDSTATTESDSGQDGSGDVAVDGSFELAGDAALAALLSGGLLGLGTCGCQEVPGVGLLLRRPLLQWLPLLNCMLAALCSPPLLAAFSIPTTT